MICSGMFFMPESPAYLVSVGREAEARKTLQWLRVAGPEEVGPELEAIKETHRMQVRQRNLRRKNQIVNMLSM